MILEISTEQHTGSQFCVVYCLLPFHTKTYSWLLCPSKPRSSPSRDNSSSKFSNHFTSSHVLHIRSHIPFRINSSNSYYFMHNSIFFTLQQIVENSICIALLSKPIILWFECRSRYVPNPWQLTNEEKNMKTFNRGKQWILTRPDRVSFRSYFFSNTMHNESITTIPRRMAFVNLRQSTESSVNLCLWEDWNFFFHPRCGWIFTEVGHLQCRRRRYRLGFVLQKTD